jgi:hypothetical protein
MRQKVYQDGELKYTITTTDGSSCEIITMPKVLIQQASLTYEGFEDVFHSFLKGDTSHKEAYYRAEKIHESYFGKEKYANYESFKSLQSRSRKK